jgi:hypothetical protein
MRHALAIGLLCGALGACALPPMGGPPPRASYQPPPAAVPPAHDDLKAARQACNTTYPAQIGNYLAHANCVNEAVERYGLKSSRYPDLVRLQEQVRSQLSARIDQRTISARDGEQQMVEADRAITAAQRERDAAHQDAADQHVARVEAMLSE